MRIRLARLFPVLNERQRRLMAAVEAREYGRGGLTVVAMVTGMSRQTIYRGIAELNNPVESERVRGSGGGRKKLSESMPEILDAIEKIVSETARGDPESPLQWTCKSVREISAVLQEKGFAIGRQWDSPQK